jgi:hypothetical protein
VTKSFPLKSNHISFTLFDLMGFKIWLFIISFIFNCNITIPMILILALASSPLDTTRLKLTCHNWTWIVDPSSPSIVDPIIKVWDNLFFHLSCKIVSSRDLESSLVTKHAHDTYRQTS